MSKIVSNLLYMMGTKKSIYFLNLVEKYFFFCYTKTIPNDQKIIRNPGRILNNRASAACGDRRTVMAYHRIGSEGTLSLLCPAKINLYLAVGKKREDGYHDIESVMQKIGLCDLLTVTVTEGEGVTLAVSNPDLSAGRDNLVYRAAAGYLAEQKCSSCLQITLEKKIPMAAGLAGGSADAAGTLKALSSLLGTLPPEKEASLALSLGADVPFCLGPNAALCRGVGEVMIPCTPLPDCQVVVAIHPSETVNTREAYRLIDQSADELPAPPSGKAMLAALAAGDFAAIGRAAFNGFESVVLPRCPRAGYAKEAMAAAGAFVSLMSGSGPSVFGLFEKDADIRKLTEHLEGQGFALFQAPPLR